MTKTERELTDGRRLLEAGEFVECEETLNKVLKREPTNIHARFFLGSMFAKTGRSDEAVKILEALIEERPNWEEAHNNLAVALQSLGRFSEALAHYKKAVEINPDFADAHNNATYILHQLQRDEVALQSVDRALALQPNRFDVLTNRAATLKSLGRIDEAREMMIKASENAPRDKGILVKVGLELNQYGEYQRSVDVFQSIIDEFPDYAYAYNCLTAALEPLVTPFTRREIHFRMMRLMDKCVELAPDYLDGQLNRATVLQKLRRNKEAREIFEKAIKEGLQRYQIFNNYAATLQESSQYEEAIEYCKKSIEITDKYAEPFYNWGANLHLLGRLEEAIEKYEMALERNPRHIDSHSALGLLYLTRGDFKRGWEEYEWRKQTDQFSGRLIDNNLINLSEIRGNTAFIHAEQGQGDMFQFVRYAQAFKAIGASTIVECHDGLGELIRTCPWVEDVRERTGDRDIVFNQQANLLSLPYLFNTTLETIPSQVPYLSAPERCRPHWKSRIDELTPAGTRLKVGIAWAGNPDHYNDKQRSTTLEKFGALARIPGVTFFSLQKGGKPEEQLADPPKDMTIVALGSEISTFSDTAAIMENLDLIIAVDTGLIHLAGAMGLPVWTLLPHGVDFRWMLDRVDTPWYPTMRLFRQRGMWDYEYVFENVAKELEAYAEDPARWQIDDAIRKFDNGDHAHAKVQLFALANRFPGDVRLINTLGEFLWADGNTTEAMQMFVAAMQIAPSDRRSLANCAIVLKAFGRQADAHAIYQNYIDTHPDDSDFAEALSNLGDGQDLAAAA